MPTPSRVLLSVCLLVLTLVVLPQPARAASADWQGVIDITFPVTGVDRHYVDDYHHARSRGAHGATDIMAPSGTPVVAARGGTITWLSTPATSGCGYCLDVTSSDGRTYGYIHLGPKSSGRVDEAFAQRWREGDRVERGEVIGYVGCSGNASCSSGGHHLHFFIEDPGVIDPYGDRRRNPYASLRAAECDPDPATPFGDVCAGSTHADAIGRLVAADLTSGCDEQRFCPTATITRQQMASFLVRALELDGSDTHPFRDVDSDNVHRRSIARLAAEGVTRGCDQHRYCPGDSVTRGQMATFLARALDLPLGGGPSFGDVPDDSVHAQSIAALAEAGVTVGCESDRFCPDEPVTRAQMATFLVRAFLD